MFEHGSQINCKVNTRTLDMYIVPQLLSFFFKKYLSIICCLFQLAQVEATSIDNTVTDILKQASSQSADIDLNTLAPRFGVVFYVR